MSSESNVYCLVLAGGKGTRLWPESTMQNPKQYLNLIGDKSLLYNSIERLQEVVPEENRFIITTEDQVKAADQATQGLLKRDGILLEPEGRDTAPCIFYSLARLQARGASDDDCVMIFPADHVILNKGGFQETIKMAVEVATKQNKLVTIGIKPNFPQTGFGYIERGSECGQRCWEVRQFKEKPNEDTARKYLESGNYYWNAGMFIGKLGTFFGEFAAHAPELASYREKLKSAPDRSSELAGTYAKLPKISIDYAIMEKSKNVMVIEALFDWNDLGSWSALADVTNPVEGNYMVNNVNPESDLLCLDAKGNIVYAPDQFVTLVGVEDLVVVSNKKVLMVMPKDQAQRVKEVVEHLRSREKTSHLV